MIGVSVVLAITATAVVVFLSVILMDWLRERRSRTVLVAAHDSSDEDKARADFTCDGEADEVEITAAIVLACKQRRWLVTLLGGSYNVSQLEEDNDTGEGG